MMRNRLIINLSLNVFLLQYCIRIEKNVAKCANCENKKICIANNKPRVDIKLGKESR